MYPLEKQFIFIHKPAVLIRFDEIESVEFQRYAGGQGSTRNFDLSVTLLNTPGDTLAVKEYTFSGIDKSNYASLYSFLSQKKIRIKNIEGVGSDEQPRSAIYDEVDEGGEGMGESSEDEDYDQNKASESESESDGSEDESDLGSLSDDSDLAEHRKAAKSKPDKADKTVKSKPKKEEESKPKKEVESKPKKEEEKGPSKKRKPADDNIPAAKKAKKDPNAPKKVSVTSCTVLFHSIFIRSHLSYHDLIIRAT